MSKRTFTQTFIDDYYDDSFRKFYAIPIMADADMASAASSSAAASSMQSFMLSAESRWFDRKRFAIPPLANNYAAIKQTIDLRIGDGPFLQVPSSTSDYSHLWAWTPRLTAAQLIQGPLPTALYAAYNEFRVRAIHVQLTPLYTKSQGYPGDFLNRWDSFIWLPSDYDGISTDATGVLDASGLNIIGPTYSKMLESGERFFKITKNMDKSIGFTYVPHTTSSIYANAQGQTSPVQMFWMDTDSNNNNVPMNAPVFVWRQPYTSAVQALDFAVTVSAVIEFRDPKTAQM